ncbi:MAG TPA: carboxypeptidase-like regulatory domain-containing protein [Pyrinomonadaceae bacterium]|jgi:hypothetical protein|nr:carboxypeptidase-like regulatory domain-containing protein [Pyrinomonadaceae bacterium]
MNLKNLLLLVAMLMLSGYTAAAQPGCPSTFNAFETCYYNHPDGQYALLGKVVEAKELENPVEGYTGALKLTLAVEESTKGPVGGEVELTLSGHCTYEVRENSKYIFIAKWARMGKVEGLLSRAWSHSLDETPPNKLAKLLNKLREVRQGGPEPRLFGTVTERGPGFSFPIRSLTRAQPLTGVVVVAEDREGNKTETQTDAEGDYTFDELPVGTYTVYPILERKMDLYANSTLLQDGMKQSVEIDNRLCGVRVDFAGQQTGNIAGRIEREKGDWKSRPSLYLFRTGSESGEFDLNDERPSLTEGYIRPSYMRPETESGTEYEFGFDRVPVGSYVLFYVIDPLGSGPALFYPVVLSHHNTELIKVELGERTDISIKVPFFQRRRIFGSVTLPDGTPVTYATIRLIDESEPEALLGERDYPNGQFDIEVWEGRPFRLNASYAGERNGKYMRFFTRTEKMILDRDTGPVTITLDQIEPH